MSVVTLTTDLGTHDYYTAHLKAEILMLRPEASIIDISHNIETHDIQHASYQIGAVWRKFPKGTIHIIGVYNYYSSSNEYIICEQEGHYFIAPNNGILSLMFQEFNASNFRKLQILESDIKEPFKLFAHGVACICSGLGLEEAGEVLEKLDKKISLQPVFMQNQIMATIIHVDHFENVVTNLKKQTFDQLCKDRSFDIFYKHNEPIQTISNSYSDVPVGEVLACFNQAGYLELAINHGRASSMLNLFKNENIQIHFNN